MLRAPGRWVSPNSWGVRTSRRSAPSSTSWRAVSGAIKFILDLTIGRAMRMTSAISARVVRVVVIVVVHGLGCVLSLTYFYCERRANIEGRRFGASFGGDRPGRGRVSSDRLARVS